MCRDLPILFIPFSRLAVAKRVFERIREQQPARLYLAIDGARTGHREEEEANAQIRCYLGDSIDWPCSVETLFKKANLGPNRFIKEALDWFFMHEDKGLILEEDCLPSPRYFELCRCLLDKYSDDPRIGMISGANVVPFFSKGRVGLGSRCIVSRYPQIWGLATWRRVWLQADHKMDQLESFIASGCLGELFARRYARRFEQLYRRMRKLSLLRWDAQWAYCMFQKKYLVLYPSGNMISNIGDHGGYNTQVYDPFLNLPVDVGPASFDQETEIEENAAFEAFMRRYIMPRSYLRTVGLMFNRWGWGAIPKLVLAAKVVLSRTLH